MWWWGCVSIGGSGVGEPVDKLMSGCVQYGEWV